MLETVPLKWKSLNNILLLILAHVSKQMFYKYHHKKYCHFLTIVECTVFIPYSKLLNTM